MQPDPITGEILKILPTVSLKVSGPGVRTVLIPGGQQVNVVPQAGTSAYVLITPGVEGIFVDALLYAADTLAMTYDDIPNVPKANESATAKALASAFENTRCLAEMDAVVQNPDISTPQAAGGIFRSFADIALGCTADTWASAYGLTGVEAAFAASTFLWLVNGIKLVFDDLQALIDTAVYWQGYHIDVRWSPQTSRPTPSPQPSKSPVLTPTTEPPGQSPTPSPPVTSTAPPPVTTTVQVTVPANGGWVDTGLRVDPSHYVTINASGSWSPDGVNYTGPDGFLYSLESADNYYNTNDLGVCATCATTDYPFWAELISYTGSAPPEPGSYTSTTVASQAKLIDGVGHSFQGPWPYTGELWLGFNDDAYSGNTSDNRGEVTATITIRHS